MQEKLFLDSKSGKVCCLHHHVEKSIAVVILGHGYLSDKQSRTNTELSKRLNSAGISTLSYDMYGHGESQGNAEYLTISKAVENLITVYDYAKLQGYKKVGVSGSSFTGIVSLIGASKRAFDVIVLKCPVFDSKMLWDDRLGIVGVKKWKESGFIEPFGKKWRFGAYEDASQYDMYAIVRGINVPILVIHGDKDETVPIKHAHEIISNSNAQLVVVAGADHFFRNPVHFEYMIKNSFDWFLLHLNIS